MSYQTSSDNFYLSRVFPVVFNRLRFVLSNFVMTITICTLLVAFLPSIACSPTPDLTSSSNNNNNNNNNDNNLISDSNAFMYGQNDDEKMLREHPMFLSSAVHNQPERFFYDEPRTQANQFLMSNVNDDQIIVPKWFTRFDDDDDVEDDDDYIPTGLVINKRSSFFNPTGYASLKKRKQLSKPPMEVMNEIVNSIYLKRRK